MALVPLQPCAPPLRSLSPARAQTLQPHGGQFVGRSGARNGFSPNDQLRSAFSSIAAALALAASFCGWRGHRHRRRFHGCRRSRCTALASLAEVDIIQKVGTKKVVETDSEVKTSKDFWAVLVHAEIGSCNMPWCAIPGISGVVCNCKKNGTTPPSDGRNKSLKTRDGKCALTMTEYAEVIQEGVPVLGRARAYRASSDLFASAMANTVGTTMVIGTFKKAAEEYRERLEGLGLWVSIVPVDRE
mmetsp:Transcript_64345/g.188282  ORF Transcript_64345/g.188282 Transcript_64345/m.188282 type:complete len:244 (-) Transcript_64345:24-755(-)